MVEKLSEARDLQQLQSDETKTDPMAVTKEWVKRQF